MQYAGRLTVLYQRSWELDCIDRITKPIWPFPFPFLFWTRSFLCGNYKWINVVNYNQAASLAWYEVHILST